MKHIIYIECECHNPEHRITLTHYPKTESEDSELYLGYVLKKPECFWDRLITGIYYIFNGNTVKFSDTLISRESAEKMIEMLQEHVDE